MEATWWPGAFVSEFKALFPGMIWFALQGVKWHLGAPSRCLSFLQNPVQVLDHVGVNAWPFPLCTTLPPARDAHQVPDLIVFTG